MERIKNTIDDVELYYARMSGNSTRQIDAAVNLLFSGYKVEVKDHFAHGTDKKANAFLFERILKRLRYEHRLDVLIEEKKIKISKNNLTIKLINQK